MMMKQEARVSARIESRTWNLFGDGVEVARNRQSGPWEGIAANAGGDGGDHFFKPVLFGKPQDKAIRVDIHRNAAPGGAGDAIRPLLEHTAQVHHPWRAGREVCKFGQFLRNLGDSLNSG